MAKIKPNLHMYEIQFEHDGKDFCLDVTTERNSYTEDDYSGRSYYGVDIEVKAIFLVAIDLD